MRSYTDKDKWRQACKLMPAWGYKLQFHEVNGYEYAYHVSPIGNAEKIGVWSPELRMRHITMPAMGWVYVR